MVARRTWNKIKTQGEKIHNDASKTLALETGNTSFWKGKADENVNKNV